MKGDGTPVKLQCRCPFQMQRHTGFPAQPYWQEDTGVSIGLQCFEEGFSLWKNRHGCWIVPVGYRCKSTKHRSLFRPVLYAPRTHKGQRAPNRGNDVPALFSFSEIPLPCRLVITGASSFQAFQLLGAAYRRHAADKEDGRSPADGDNKLPA